MTTEVLNIKQSKEKVSICQQVKNDVAMYIVTDLMAELRPLHFSRIIDCFSVVAIEVHLVELKVFESNY